MRHHLCVLSDVFIFKDRQLTGQGNKAITRARGLAARYRKKVDVMVARYRYAFSVLEILDPNGSWTTNLKLLDDIDVRPMKDDEKEHGEGA